VSCNASLLIGILAAAAPLIGNAQPHVEMLRDLYGQHLAVEQREHGEFDAHTAEAARNLGLFLRGHGDPAAAYTALSRTVAIDEKVFGPDAPRTLADVADLATVAPAADTPKLFERAAGSSDAAAASRALVALGELRASQKDREGAARYWRQALAKQEADSQNTAMILTVLAQVIAPAEAIPILRRALAIDRKNLGPRHPEYATVDQLLGAALLATGKPAEAEPPGREALDVLSEKLGSDHPRTAAAAVTLATILRATGKFAEAERLYRQALAVDEAVLGSQDPGTLDTVRALADLLRDRGRKGEATVLERRLVVNVAQ
jgi:tetratricopeptide (TPR) repeat protein